jgi:hypothetical protein
VEAELKLMGTVPKRFEIITDPDRRKLTRNEFDTMVREVLEDTFALFALSSFRKSVARGAGTRPPPIARLEFLRSRISELEAIAKAIAGRPRRTLAGFDAVLPYWKPARATGPEIIRSLRTGRVLEETHGGASRLPVELKGKLPERIRVRHRRSSLDLPEHRQMAACLRSWAAWLTAVAGLLDRPASDDGEVRQSRAAWASRCRRLSRRVNQVARLPPFSEAGPATPHLTITAVFRNDPNYRRFYKLWQEMNLGIASVFGDFLGMPLSRTFELYERWCFLRLVRAATEEYGPSGVDMKDLFIRDAAGGVHISAGAVTVDVGSGWKLCFQKQYREFWIEPSGEGTFSRSMTPDVVLMQEVAPSCSVPSRLIVLDAKYRINDNLNDALSSIHTYRDALVREVSEGKIEGIVTATYLLTPHVPALSPSYRTTQLPSRLFHPQYRRAFKFGAVTLSPGMPLPQISAALKEVVADAVS